MIRRPAGKTLKRTESVDMSRMKERKNLRKEVAATACQSLEKLLRILRAAERTAVGVEIPMMSQTKRNQAQECLMKTMGNLTLGINLIEKLKSEIDSLYSDEEESQ